ncbi:hypothetical protein [Pseudomonas sp. R2-7-07]|uniref:hypothetical protein n=1 Tax=Pseudomonas sp. R2-7-07 TaxID=658641 RepID=UPI000F55CEBA|nr:hypothetical protein [Pseudomonas sp. R2-7-07]
MKYFNWMLGYQGGVVDRPSDDRKSMHVMRALSAEVDENLEWLGNVPAETVLNIRRAGLAEELRYLLGHGVSELIKVRPENYFRTADQGVDDLDRALAAHQTLLKDARNKKLSFTESTLHHA